MSAGIYFVVSVCRQSNMIVISRVVVCMLFTAAVVRVSDCEASPRYMAHFDAPPSVPTRFQRIAVDGNSGYVYVGGSDTLFQFDEDLLQEDMQRTGPVEGSVHCNPANRDCFSEKKLMNNEAKILDIDPKSGYLIHCGSVKQGLCSMYPQNQIKQKIELNPSNRVNFAGGLESVHGFFGRGRFGDSSGENQTSFYVASSYDQRPLELLPKTVSARRISKTADNFFNITYAYEDPVLNRFSGIDIDPEYKRTYPVEYLYGFEHQGFTYFVTVQRTVTVSDQPYETRLIRVCQDDKFFNSYTELKLQCRKNNGITTFYNIAQGAHLAPIGKDLARFLHKDPNDTALYISFGKSDGNKNKSSEKYGSGLCLFSMAEVQEAFENTQRECYMGQGNILPWINHQQPPCEANLSIAKDISKSFCGHPTNVGIGSRYPMAEETIVTIDTHLVTALKVTTYKDNIVGIVGTSDGQVMKVLIDGRNAAPYAMINVMQGLGKLAPVARDMEFDRNRRHVYALTANRVSKVPIQSCGIYTDCSECVLTTDPLNCGWCGDHCSTHGRCRHTFTPNSCPPRMYNFSPRSGPLNGGTLVTIEGKYFGNSSAASLSQASVKVALKTCSVQFRNTSLLVCRTGSTTNAIDREVEVEILDPSKTTEPFIIRGEASSEHESFSYKDPKVTEFRPLYGPKAGGTRLTIYGSDLDIGTSLEVTVASRVCRTQSTTATHIVCVTSQWRDTATSAQNTDRLRRRRSPRASVEGMVNISIDATDLSVEGTLFTYRDDPEIYSMEPTTSIISGGFPVTVHGQNLDVVMAPRIEATVRGNEAKIFTEECRSDAAGTTMMCPTPNITLTTSQVTPDNPLLVAIQFVMDGVSPSPEQFKYYVDPVIYKFEGAGNLRLFYHDETLLAIQGDYIDFAAAEDNVKVFMDGQRCNVTSLGTTVIVCKPERPLELSEEEPYRKVQVKIGNKVYEVGNLQFTNRRTDLLVAMILGPCLGVVCILLVILTLVWMKKTHRGPFRKKVPGEPNVRYARGNIVEIGGRDQVYRLNPNPVENPYWTDNQPQIVRHRNVLQAQQIALLDDETLRLIDDSQLYIDRDRLLLLEIIGQGHFGCVYRGFMKVGDKKEEMEVAVKTLKSLRESSYTSTYDARKFLDEALRMREFDHPHILRLIGITLDRETLPLVVLPFMKHGDLLSYIRNELNSPTVKDLIDFGIQSAEGMAYLSNLKFVHRDLAARNCMLDDNMLIKVADFGLSRDIYERDYYSSDDRKAKLPVKWMALESLEKGIYNTKTDVWSFGVVLWELMTRGVCPYPDVDNWDIIKYLKMGRRMPQPMYCPDALYAVMMQCWSVEPKLRPSFSELVHAIKSIVTTMEQAHQTIGVNITYVNVPMTQGYLYPQLPIGSRSTLI